MYHRKTDQSRCIYAKLTSLQNFHAFFIRNQDRPGKSPVRIHLCIFLLFERIHRLQVKKQSAAIFAERPAYRHFWRQMSLEIGELCLRYGGGKSGRIDIAFDEERRRA